LGVSEIQFSMTGRNKLGVPQLHIGHFEISGYVIGPRRILSQIPAIAGRLLPRATADASQAAEPLTQTVINPSMGAEVKPPMEPPPPEQEPAILAPDNVVVMNAKSEKPDDMNDDHIMDKGDDITAEPNAGGGGVGGDEARGAVRHVDNDGEGEVESDGGEKQAMPRGLITEVAGIEEIRELSSSRFGAVRLVRRESEKGNGWELFAAKFYNAGDSKESRETFMTRMQPFIYLKHPGIMPICGMIAPTKGTGPIVLTPYSECGSLEDVLNRVRKNDPPPFWNNTTITKILFSLITGLEYLHRQGMVHRELKPSDVIIYADGTAKVDGYLTNYLEEHKLTKATQVGSPFYMAPEVYDDEEEGLKSKDPKTDVFSFALIGFELVAIARVFPTSMAAAAIMRKVMSARRDDRPKIPDNVPSALSDLIQRCWVPLPSKRPTFEAVLCQMNALEFRFFPDVSLRLTMPLSVVEPASKSLLQGLPPDRPDGNRTRRKAS
jgi:serine/threonine-protein kinase 11